MCDKAVNTYPSIIQFVPECYSAQEICDKAVNRCFCLYLFEMCYGVVSEDNFLIIYRLIVYCHDKYRTQRMCDEAVDDCLAAMKFIPDWFAISKCFKN